MDKDMKLEIDKRNLLCVENYSKPDTSDFIFDDYCKTTCDMSEKIEYADGVFGAQLALIMKYSTLGEYTQTFRQLEQLNDDYVLDKLSLKNQMDYYGLLAIHYGDYEDDLELAIEYFKKEMSFAELIGNQYEVMRIKMNISGFSFDLGLFDTAFEFLNEACEFYESTNNNQLLCYCYINFAYAYYSHENFESSKEYLLKTIDLSRKENEPSITSEAIHMLGLIAGKEKNFKEAISLMKESLEMNSEHPNMIADINIYLDLIDVYLEQDNYCQAENELSIIENEIESIVKIDDLKRFYKSKASIYENLGDFEKAYESINKYIDLNDNKAKEKSVQSMNALIQEEYSKSILRLETIASVGRELTSLSDIDEVLLRVRSELVKVLDIDVIGIGEVVGKELCFNHYFTASEKVSPKNILLSKKTSLATWCIKMEEEVIINDLENEYKQYIEEFNTLSGRDSLSDDAIQSLMYAPLKINDEVIGVFTIQSTSKEVYSSVESKIFNIITDYVSIAVKNVTQRLALEELVERDILTKMYNRRGFVDYFNHQVTDKVDSISTIAIIMFDLDHFKAVNDKFGHLTGDEVLKIVGRALMAGEREDIRTGRLGGEEFGMIIINKNLEEVNEIANRMRMTIENLSIINKSVEIKITSSVGVSYRDNLKGIEYNQLYFEADNALYKAKADGRNNVKVYIS